MQNIKIVWTRPKYFWMEGMEIMSALSILVTKEQCGEVVVYADRIGERWLTEMQLPIKEIVTVLDKVPGDGNLFAEGKLWTFRDLAERGIPFIASDLDVFPWRGWSKRVTSASIVAERHYWLNHDWAAGMIMNDEWRDAIARRDGISFACGTYGGNDLEAIARIASAGLDFMESNRKALNEYGMSHVCMMAEEWAIARGYDWNEVTTVLPPHPVANLFTKTAPTYHHRLYSKRTPEGIANMADRLETMCPGQVRRCEDVGKAFQFVTS